jgi:hypothetical protein
MSAISIPSSENFVSARAKQDHIAKLEVATQRFVEEMTKIFVDHIRTTDPTKGKVVVVIPYSQLGVYGGIHGTVLLYGHHTRDTPFHIRKPLEIRVPAFRRLQNLFYNVPGGTGWYLIEESDPAINQHNARFVLYGQKPSNKHYYFNRGKLWHTHDMFYEDLPVQVEVLGDEDFLDDGADDGHDDGADDGDDAEGQQPPPLPLEDSESDDIVDEDTIDYPMPDDLDTPLEEVKVESTPSFVTMKTESWV